MNAIIIEDEVLSQSKLESLLLSIDPHIRIVAKLQSVKESVQFLSGHPSPDVAFVDIQLSDDHSFEIFKQCQVRCPVIFTTAYDKFLLESFEHNAIDYLLKPITAEKLKRSLDKLKNLELHFVGSNLERLTQGNFRTRDRIVAKKGTEFRALRWVEIAYFFTEHKIVFVRDFNGRQYIVDKNLAELGSEIDENTFFRLNRKFIANISAIEKFKPDNGKIRIYLRPEMKEEVHVSKESAPLFRKWVTGKNGE
jgi:DNA-binding LytR/AlgR family response regulator